MVDMCDLCILSWLFAQFRWSFCTNFTLSDIPHLCALLQHLPREEDKLFNTFVNGLGRHGRLAQPLIAQYLKSTVKHCTMVGCNGC